MNGSEAGDPPGVDAEIDRRGAGDRGETMNSGDSPVDRTGKRAGGDDRPVIAIVGPTAVGKTGVAVRLAEALSGEIVSLDSRQMYQHVDVGTAKPTAEERAKAPHHLVDIAAPDEILSLADIQARAFEAVDSIRRRGRTAILAGGTGQYVWAVLEGWRIPAVEADEAFRSRMLTEAEVAGPEALHARLNEIDPVSAARIHVNNVRRVIRALEVWHHTGVPMSEAQRKLGPPWPVRILGLRMPRPELYARIDLRIDAMIDAGLENEVRTLVESGLSFDLPALQSVGYREWRAFFEGDADRDEVIRSIRRNTRRLVRMQSTWFREDDARIWWVDALLEAADDEIVRTLVDEGTGDR